MSKSDTICLIQPPQTLRVHCMLMSLLLALLTGVVTTLASAQTATLHGTVTDEKTSEGIHLATITVTPVGFEKQPTRTTAGPTGKFEIKGLAAGTYTVTVSHIGYAKKVLDDIELASGETKLLEISLSPIVFQLPPVITSVSRYSEKALHAPAAVSVLEASQIQDRAASTPTEHLKSMPAVDIVSSGLTQSNVVVRGFNTAFSGALMSLVDNRIARIPSLRSNVYSLIPTTNEDIERIEVVSGPGSALYGPNSANGVMHILTKSPLGSEGTKVSIGAGERSVFMGSLRHAGSYKNRVGYKVSSQYYRGNDWEYEDPAEPSSPGRDFDLDKLSGEARLDFRLTEDLTTILSGGFTRMNQIELTGIGAAQGKDWTYSYFQGRLLYKNLFAQAFLNRSDAGDTFILRSGEDIIDRSSLFVGQIQHGLRLADRQRFTYGMDLLLTRPETEGSINGRNEENDDINEIGAYVQSETKLTSQFKFVAAARLDKHNRLEDAVFSPRAALVFKPNVNSSFRATYNRAFTTPTANHLFLDILSKQDVFGLGALFQDSLGFSPSTDVRAQGVPETGFHFSRSANDLPMFRSPFAPLAKRPTSDFIEQNDPLFTNVMWGIGRQAVLANFLPTFKETLAKGGLPQAQIDALSQAFTNIVSQQVDGVKNVLRTLNPETQGFDPTGKVMDIEPIKPTITQTFEVGYKGFMGSKLVLAVDAYHTKIKDFIGTLIVETPNVFLDSTTLSASLTEQFGTALKDPKNADLNTVLLVLDEPSRDGNGNKSAVDELTKLFVDGAASIPFGTVTPKEAVDATAIMLTYRNYGDISLNGADFNFTYYLNQNWNFRGNYSFVSKDIFKNVDGVSDIALNAPKHKFGASVQYLYPDWGLDIQLRLRYVASFPVNSGVYIGEVDSYAVLDLNVGYSLPFSHNTRWSLTMQNLLNKKHQEFVGAPEIGRLAMVRLTQSF